MFFSIRRWTQTRKIRSHWKSRKFRVPYWQKHEPSTLDCFFYYLCVFYLGCVRPDQIPICPSWLGCHFRYSPLIRPCRALTHSDPRILFGWSDERPRWRNWCHWNSDNRRRIPGVFAGPSGGRLRGTDAPLPSDAFAFVLYSLPSVLPHTLPPPKRTSLILA